MKEFFKLHKVTLIGATIILLLLFFISIYHLYSKYGDMLDKEAILLIGTEKLLIMILFLIVFKLVLSTNMTYNAFKKVSGLSLADRDFLKSVDCNKRIEVAKIIGEIDSDSIIVSNMPEEEKSKAKLENDYSAGSEYPYILLESIETQTLYSNGHYILHKRVHMKMMKTEALFVDLKYIPFDKKISTNPKQDPYWLNRDKDRWPDYKNEKPFPHKTFRFYSPGDTVPGIDQDIKVIRDESGRDWLQFIANTEQEIGKGTEFVLEFIVTDYVSLDNDDASKKRRKEFFSNDIKANCGIRRIRFQTEIYNDRAARLHFYPTLKLDDIANLESQKEHCKESMFYRFWEWSIIYGRDDNKNYTFQLVDLNPEDHIACNKIVS